MKANHFRDPSETDSTIIQCTPNPRLPNGMHCPLRPLRPEQTDAVLDAWGDMYVGPCPWMSRLILQGFQRGNILGYDGFQFSDTLADEHQRFADDTLSHIHIRSDLGYAQSYWAMYHEAAHIHLDPRLPHTEEEIDALALSCS